MSYSDVAVVVPWRLVGDRKESFKIAWKYNSETLAGFETYFSDSADERFNVAEARNRGCLQAIADGHKTLIVVDADTVFEKDGIVDALKVIKKTGRVCYPYTYSLELEKKVFNRMETNTLPFSGYESFMLPSQHHVGSGWVMTADYFQSVNGWDERFLGWGWEDHAFQRTYEILHGEQLPRAEGTCYRLWHEVRDILDYDKNHDRFMYEYQSPRASLKRFRKVLSGNMVHLA